jgi:hypothetical protein
MHSGWLVALAAVVASMQPLAAQPAKKWEAVAKIGKMQMVWVARDLSSDKRVYDDAIAALCSSSAWCGLHFWTDRSKIPSRFPMTDEQVNAEVAAYTYNPQSNFRQFLWNCQIQPRPNRTECMAQ